MSSAFRDSPPSWAIHDVGGPWDENKINVNIGTGAGKVELLMVEK